MKKTSIAILVCLLCTFSVFARGNSESYLCDVVTCNMPEGTVYIDMLIPLSAEDVEFSFFNNANGKKYNVLPNSEIALYDKDGFFSYTFHTKSGRARLKPFAMGENRESLFVEYLADDAGYDKGGFSEIDEFGEKYKKAKFAYLDVDGNVLAVTNEIDIWNNFAYSDIFITLSGTKASSEMNKDYTDLWAIVLMVIVIAPIIIFLLGIVTAIACVIAFVVRHRKDISLRKGKS